MCKSYLTIGNILNQNSIIQKGFIKYSKINGITLYKLMLVLHIYTWFFFLNDTNCEIYG